MIKPNKLAAIYLIACSFITYGQDLLDQEDLNSLEQNTLQNKDLNNLNKKLTYFKLPAYINFTDSLPVTSSQKIIKKGLLKKIKEEKNRYFYDLSELKRKLNS